MKRKSPRDIPDFSRKSAPARAASSQPASAPARPAARPTPTPTVKPKATSAKTGQRGR